jgi:hypothetical protein
MTRPATGRALPDLRRGLSRHHVWLAIISLALAQALSAARPPAMEAPPSLVVGVALWRNVGGPERDIQGQTYDRLVEALGQRPLGHVAVVKVPVELRNADEVDSIVRRHGVDVLIWGWYDEIGIRGYVDLADSTTADGMANSLAAFLENGGSPDAIWVLDVLGEFSYLQDGVSFCVPRWTP